MKEFVFTGPRSKKPLFPLVFGSIVIFAKNRSLILCTFYLFHQ